MHITVHAMCWNEQELLPFFIKHYKSIADHIVIHDNYSTDHSRSIAEAAGCEVWTFQDMQGGMNDVMHQEIKNTAWKGSMSNWVIMVDMDEFLKVDRKTLDDARFHMKTIFHTQGYDMYDDHMPEDSIWELNQGILNDSFSKCVIFNPRAIADMNYTPGSHHCSPQGKVAWDERILPLCHYHAIGGLHRFLEKRYIRARRQSATNRRLGHSTHYSFPEARQVAIFQEGIAARTPLFNLSATPK